MTIQYSIKTSISLLLAHKTRSFLTMLGIIIGVASVIIIMAVGAGAQSLVVSQVETLGSDIIGVMPGKANDKGPPASVMGIVITTLTYDDLEAIRDKKNVPNLVEAVGYTKAVAAAAWKSNTYDTNIAGVTHGYMEVEGGELLKGRFITQAEERNMARVAVLASTVAQELFGESDPIGQRIKIKKHTFEVVGVMRERGVVAFQNYDDQIFLPLKTVQKLISGVNHLGIIRAKIDSEMNVQRVLEDVRATLRDQHEIADQSGKNDDFTVRSAAQALEIITSITDGLRFFLAAIAALSLVVGGIGIMNISLVNVKSRTREIGLRKSLGANNSHILNQFLIETITMTGIGGIIGVVFGIAASFIISVIAHALGYDSWDFIISPFHIALALIVAALVGLIFGLYPAKKASKLEPIESLRYE